MDRIQIIPGIAMPFFPMRPSRGPRLATPAQVREVLALQKDELGWISQPKLNDHRACLAVVDGNVVVQNRHGAWFQGSVRNTQKWGKLWNRTVLDGGVYEGKFFAFECLALFGKSMLKSTVLEREAVAKKMSQLCDVPWLFERPTGDWLMGRGKHAPQWEGVVLKRINAPYTIHGSATQSSPDWVKRRWS